VIHLYAVTRGVVPGSLRGLEDVPVSAVAVGDLHAVISRHELALRANETQALRHVAVIEALAAHADVLPVRYGSQHEREDDLRRRLEEQLPQLHDLLQRVGGHVEFVVRPVAAVPQPPAGQLSVPRAAAGGAPDAGTGRAYLEQRLAEERASAEELAASRARLRDATEELVGAAAAVHELTRHDRPERCFLVARPAAGSFGERARQLVGGSDRYVVGGPWPPFTFASLPVDAEVAR
jgi:hypothetical protein